MEPSDRIILIPRFRARPDRRQELAQRLQAMAEMAVQEDGCLEWRVHVDPLDPSTFVLYELWADKDSLNAHDRSSHLKEFLADLPDLLVEPFSVDRLRMLSGGLQQSAPSEASE